MSLRIINRHSRFAVGTFGMLVAALLALPCTAAAQAKRYGDVSYAQPSDCSLITRMNPYNPYAYLLREHCEQSRKRG